MSGNGTLSRRLGAMGLALLVALGLVLSGD